jgi:hypothetical protein
MKIVSLLKSCGEFYRTDGFKHVFESAGHHWLWWNQSQTPIFDILDQNQDIDIFWGTTFDLTESIVRALNERPEIKLVLKGGDWGPITPEVRRWAQSANVPCPIVFAEDKDILLTEKLVHKNILIICHYHENSIENTMSGWQELGVKVAGIPNAADIFEYSLGEVKPEFISDVSYVGGYWPHKAINMNQYLMKILPSAYPQYNFSVKIWGNQGFQLVPEFLGHIDTKHVRHIYRSAKVCPSFSEPHSTKFGYDVIERPFKVLSSGGFCISDYVRSLYDDFFSENQLPVYRNFDEFMFLTETAIKNPADAQKIAAQGRKVVLQEHTYFHRVDALLKRLGLTEDAKIIMDRWNVLKEIYDV